MTTIPAPSTGQASAEENARIAAEIARLTTELEAERTTPLRDFADPRLATFVQAVHETADDNSMCTVFDDVATAIGMPGRARTWRVAAMVTVQVPVFIDVEANGSQAAVDALTARNAREVRDEIEHRIRHRDANFTDSSVWGWRPANPHEHTPYT